MPPTPYTPLLPQRPLPPPDTSPWNECQALSQQLKRFSLLRPNSLCILSGWSGIFCLAFCCFCFQLFWWQLGTRQAFSLVLHFFFFFYVACIYLRMHTFNWFCLIMRRCVWQSSRKTSFFFMLLILNSVLTTFTIECFFFFPASTKAVFLFNYHTSINPALCFALHAGELLLSVMFVLL